MVLGDLRPWCPTASTPAESERHSNDLRRWTPDSCDKDNHRTALPSGCPPAGSRAIAPRDLRRTTGTSWYRGPPSPSPPGITPASVHYCRARITRSVGRDGRCHPSCGYFDELDLGFRFPNRHARDAWTSLSVHPLGRRVGLDQGRPYPIACRPALASIKSGNKGPTLFLCLAIQLRPLVSQTLRLGRSIRNDLRAVQEARRPVLAKTTTPNRQSPTHPH